MNKHIKTHAKHHEDVLLTTHGCIQTSYKRGKDATEQTRWPQRPTSTNPQRENKQTLGKDQDLSKQAWIQSKKH